MLILILILMLMLMLLRSSTNCSIDTTRFWLGKISCPSVTAVFDILITTLLIHSNDAQDDCWWWFVLIICFCFYFLFREGSSTHQVLLTVVTAFRVHPPPSSTLILIHTIPVATAIHGHPVYIHSLPMSSTGRVCFDSAGVNNGSDTSIMMLLWPFCFECG